MKRVAFTISLIAFLTVNVFSQAIPKQISYQGVLKDASGNILTGDFSMTFKIYNDPTGGSALWTEVQTVAIVNGLFNVQLGNINPITAVPFDRMHFLGITVGTESELSPRTLLSPSPYSFMSMNVMDNVITKNKIQDGAVTGLKIGSNEVVKSLNGLKDVVNFIGGTNITLTPSGNDIIISSSAIGDNWGTQSAITDQTLSGDGTASLPLKLSQQSASGGQVLKWNGTSWAPAQDNTGGLILPYSGTGTSGSPLFNIVNLGTSGAISTLSNGNYAIWGESASSSGMGVYGVNKTSTGTTYGVFGDVYSSAGYSGYFKGGRFFIQGNTGIGTQTPSSKLEVAGQVKITGGNPGIGKVLTSDASGLASWQLPEFSPWLKNGDNIYYNSGNIGIGLNNPIGMMEIYGNSIDSYPHLLLSEADGYSRVSFRTMAASNKHWVLAGHTNLTDATSQWHLNYNNGTIGKNIFSVYGDSKIGFDGDVGIGTQTPSAKLEVAGQVKITGGTPGTGKVLTSDASGLASWQIPESSPWLKNGSNLYYNSGNVAIGMTIPRYSLTIYNDNNPQIGFYNSTSGTSGTDGFTISTGSSGSPVWIWNWENSNMHFATNNTNRMIIDADGHVSMMRYLDLNTDGTFGALYVAGNQALWWDGTYFSWGYGGQYNYFADKVTIGNPSDPSYMLYVQGSAYATGTWSSSDARFKRISLPLAMHLIGL